TCGGGRGWGGVFIRCRGVSRYAPTSDSDGRGTPRPYEDRFPDWGEWEERILRGPVPFEVLDALTELVVGEMDEGARFAELLGYIGLVLRVSDINEGIEAFGQKVHLMAEPFDQYPAI